MTFAITIGSYALPEFIELTVPYCRKVFPDTPILVSDDLSTRSGEIRDVANKLGVYHLCSEEHRGHFAGDAGHFVNALAFAREQKADLALKLSQRFILLEPVCREIIERYFTNPDTWLSLPGRLAPGSIKRLSSKFFAQFPLLTDCVCLRVSRLSPEQFKDAYEGIVNNRRMWLDGYIESFFARLLDTSFNGHTVLMPEFSGHVPGRDRIYLRRAQSENADYQLAALAIGLQPWHGPLQEWRELNPHYRPLARFV